MIAFVVGAIITVAITLGVRTSCDKKPYLYNDGKLGCLEEKSVYVTGEAEKSKAA